MDIHPSYNILLRRPWIHVSRVVAFLLLQCLKYIMNKMLIIVKVKETVSIIRNVVVPFIKVNYYKDIIIHAFEIVNAKWVLEGVVLRELKVSEAARITASFFLKYEILFHYDPKTRMSERVNLMKLKCMN
jgi:hypothetical protein